MPIDTPMYHDIHVSLASVFPNFTHRNEKEIPDCKRLNQGFNCSNLNKKQLIFVRQNSSMSYPEMGYEERIYRKGIIATRSLNWYDFFNAMVWHNFTQTKVAINAIHFQQMQLQKDSMRSRQRDLLTLFDECGVIIIAKAPLLELLRQHKWQRL